MSEPVALPVARAAFLRLVLPQLISVGFERLAASYAVEIQRLEGRSQEEVYCEFWGSCSGEGHQHGSAGDRCLYCDVDLSLALPVEADLEKR